VLLVLLLPKEMEAGNPEAEIPSDGEQLCPGPRDFWLSAFAGWVLKPRWVLPVTFVVVSSIGISLAVCPQIYTLGADLQNESCSLADATALSSIAAVSACLARPTILHVLVELRRFTATTTKDNELVLLGGGSKMIAAPPVDSSHCWQLIHVVSGRDIRGCAKMWTGMVFVFSLIWCVHTQDTIRAAAAGNWQYALFYGFPMSFYNICVMPLGVCWYLTLKQGAALVSARVVEAQRSVARHNVMDAQWETEVVAEIVSIATSVLPLLSKGWSAGAAMLCLGCWTMSISNICRVLQSQHVTENVVAAVCFIVSPMLILWDVASAGTECDNLMKALNDKRISDISDESHVKIHKLEILLGHLNKVRCVEHAFSSTCISSPAQIKSKCIYGVCVSQNQGLGFSLFGKIIDKALFCQILLKFGALSFTVYGLVHELGYGLPLQPLPSSCGLTAMQEQTISEMITALNGTIRCGVRRALEIKSTIDA
jgi:hypothetical protein